MATSIKFSMKILFKQFLAIKNKMFYLQIQYEIHIYDNDNYIKRGRSFFVFNF